MPPKPKFTREEIISAGLDLVSKKGIDALTARNLAEKLGSSSRPIFTVFNSMEELQAQVCIAAMERYNSYAKIAVNYTPAFKQFGMQMIKFSQDEPMLFKLLFMTNNGKMKNIDDIIDSMGETAEICEKLLQNDYFLDEEQAKQIFHHCWIYTFGICSLRINCLCRFSPGEISDLLGQDFLAMLSRIKSGRVKQLPIHPIQC